MATSKGEKVKGRKRYGRKGDGREGKGREERAEERAGEGRGGEKGRAPMTLWHGAPMSSSGPANLGDFWHIIET